MKLLQNKWVLLITLSLIWGSSFILIKRGLEGLSPIELGVFRILFTGIFLILFGRKSLKKIQTHHWKYIILTALLGTFIPVFLFAFAINSIDSSVASILNSLTPFNTFLAGILFFGMTLNRIQLTGIIVGLLGTVLLIVNGSSIHPNQNYWYASLVIIASIGYGFNVNIIKHHLRNLSALSITTGNFVVLLLPTTIVLISTEFIEQFSFENTIVIKSLSFIFILAIIGTALAKVMFNKLIQISDPIFSASVTYLIPIVAVIWGLIDGETMSLTQFLAAGIILFGIYLVLKKNK